MRSLLLFSAGGSIYLLIEVLYRRRTHISMLFVGGLSVCIIDKIYASLCGLLPTLLICALCGVAVTVTEFFSGIVINKILRLSVWDYSDRKWNIRGQVCPLFAVYWSLLSYPAIVFSRLISRYL